MSEDRAGYGKAGQKVNREDVVQAALLLERWCEERCTNSCEPCDCPFAFGAACVASLNYPQYWGLEEFLRNRGMRHEKDVTG